MKTNQPTYAVNGTNKRYTVRTLIYEYDLLLGHYNSLAQAQFAIVEDKRETSLNNWDLLQGRLNKDGWLKPSSVATRDEVYKVRDNANGRIIAAY
jgi:hypothetical protein